MARVYTRARVEICIFSCILFSMQQSDELLIHQKTILMISTLAGLEKAKYVLEKAGCLQSKLSSGCS